MSSLLLIVSRLGWETQRLWEEGLAAAVLGVAPSMAYLATLPFWWDHGDDPQVKPDAPNPASPPESN